MLTVYRAQPGHVVSLRDSDDPTVVGASCGKLSTPSDFAGSSFELMTGEQIVRLAVDQGLESYLSVSVDERDSGLASLAVNVGRAEINVSRHLITISVESGASYRCSRAFHRWHCSSDADDAG